MQDLDYSGLTDSINREQFKKLFKRLMEAEARIYTLETLVLELTKMPTTDKAKELANDIKTKRNRV